jgi:hypothetical protein
MHCASSVCFNHVLPYIKSIKLQHDIYKPEECENNVGAGIFLVGMCLFHNLQGLTCMHFNNEYAYRLY